MIFAAKTQPESCVYLKAIEKYIRVRNGTTDLSCIVQIFGRNECRPPFNLSPQLIVDAGANIGIATLYFAHRYPNAQIMAIEPEASNFEMLQRNCEGLPNITLIQAALWPTKSPLEIVDPRNGAWAFRITEHSGRPSSVPASGVTIADILERARTKQIDLLKIDIEGSELQLFSIGAQHWIGQIQAIAIELHDNFLPGCAQAFYSVVTTRKFIQQINGENIFVKFLEHQY